jgi:hypothetical protein
MEMFGLFFLNFQFTFLKYRKSEKVEYTPASLQNLSQHAKKKKKKKKLEKEMVKGGSPNVVFFSFFFLFLVLERAILIGLSPIFLGTLGTPQRKAPLWTPSTKIKLKCALL